MKKIISVLLLVCVLFISACSPLVADANNETLYITDLSILIYELEPIIVKGSIENISQDEIEYYELFIEYMDAKDHILETVTLKYDEPLAVGDKVPFYRSHYYDSSIDWVRLTASYRRG